MAESEIEKSSPSEEQPDGSTGDLHQIDGSTGDLHQISVESHQFYQGPLPPPQALAEYEKILPGLAQTIVDTAQKEQAFRHKTTHCEQETERKFYRQAAIKTYLGQIGAFVIAMTTLVGCIGLIKDGHSVAGIAGIVTALVALSAVFIVGKLLKAKEVSEHADAN